MLIHTINKLHNNMQISNDEFKTIFFLYLHNNLFCDNNNIVLAYVRSATAPYALRTTHYCGSLSILGD